MAIQDVPKGTRIHDYKYKSNIRYYLDEETNEVVRVKVVKALSKTDYVVAIKDNGDVISIPNGAVILWNTPEEARRKGNWDWGW